MLESIVVQNTTFVLLLSYRSISVGLSLVYCSPCILMYRCPIVVFLNFSRCLLIGFSVRSGHVFSKDFFIALKRLVVVGLRSAACRYCDSSGLDVCTRILFVADSDCCVSRGTYHIPFFLFLVTLIIYFPFFWTNISCLSSVVVHPLSHKTPTGISEVVFISG